MKKIDLGQTISVIANVGVILGIVFLAVELDQNQQILEQQLTLDRLTGRDAALGTFNGFRSQLLENPYLIPVWNKGLSGEPLNEDEREQFELLCANYIWSQVTLYARFSALDMVDEVNATTAILRDQRASERFRQCWDDSKRMIALRGYGTLIDMVESESDD